MDIPFALDIDKMTNFSRGVAFNSFRSVHSLQNNVYKKCLVSATSRLSLIS